MERAKTKPVCEFENRNSGLLTGFVLETLSLYQQNSKVMVMQRLNTSKKIQLTPWISREKKMRRQVYRAKRRQIVVSQENTKISC
jgi:hypothetical protein